MSAMPPSLEAIEAPQNHPTAEEHAVLHAEVVRVTRELASLHTHARQLEAQLAELAERDESSRQTLVEVRQMVIDRDTEMIARSQQLHDDLGKARAELAIAQRAMELERLELQSQCGRLLTDVTNARLAAEQEKIRTDMQVTELTTAVTLAQAAQHAAELQSSSAVQAAAEAKQALETTNTERDTALEQASDARAERDGAVQTALEANQGKAEAVLLLTLAHKERDAALASLAAKAVDLDRCEEAKSIAEQGKAGAEAALAAAQKGRSAAEEDLAAAQGSLAQQVEQTANLQQLVDQTQQQLRGTQAERDALATKAEQLVKQTQQQLRESQAEQNDLVRKAEQLVQAHVAAVAEAADKHAKALSEEQARLEAAQEALGTAAAKVSAAEADRAVLCAEIVSLKAGLGTTQAAGQQAVRIAQEQIQDLTDQLETSVADGQVAKEQIAAVQQHRDSFQQELQSSRDEVSRLTGLLNNAQQQLKRAERHRALARQQLDAQEEDFGRLGRDLQKAATPARSTKPPSSHPEVPRRLFPQDRPMPEIPEAEESEANTDEAKTGAQRAPAAVSAQSGSVEEERTSNAGQENSPASDTLTSLAGTPKAVQQSAEPKLGLLASITETASRFWSSPTLRAKKRGRNTEPAQVLLEPQAPARKKGRRVEAAGGGAAVGAQGSAQGLLAIAAATPLPHTAQEPLKATLEQTPEVQQLFEEYEAALGGVTDPAHSPAAKRQCAAEAAQLAEAVVIEAAAAAAAAGASADQYAASFQDPAPGHRATRSAAVKKSNANGVQSGAMSKAVSETSRGASRGTTSRGPSRRSPAMPASEPAHLHNLRSRSVVPAEPEHATMVDDTAGSSANRAAAAHLSAAH